MKLDHLFLAARVGDTRLALPSMFVDSVVRMAPVVAVPRVDPAVRGLMAVRSRVLTLIDVAARVGTARTDIAGGLAIIVDVSGHSYGLIVDAVDDVVALPPEAMMPPLGLSAAWAPFVDALAERDGSLLLVLDIERLIAGELRHAA